jgi:hypothetical protein
MGEEYKIQVEKYWSMYPHIVNKFKNKNKKRN